jgi:hypothetical protein
MKDRPCLTAKLFVWTNGESHNFVIYSFIVASRAELDVAWHDFDARAGKPLRLVSAANAALGKTKSLLIKGDSSLFLVEGIRLYTFTQARPKVCLVTVASRHTVEDCV